MPGHSPSGVNVSEASMQFFVEALRANTNVLEMVGKSMAGLQAEQKEQLKLIHDVRERVIRIESVPSLGREVSELRGEFRGVMTKVQAMETQLAADQAADKAKSSTWEGIVRYGPSVAIFLFSILAGVFLILGLTGRLQPEVRFGGPTPSEASVQLHAQPANPQQ